MYPKRKHKTYPKKITKRQVEGFVPKLNNNSFIAY